MEYSIESVRAFYIPVFLYDAEISGEVSFHGKVLSEIKTATRGSPNLKQEEFETDAAGSQLYSASPENLTRELSDDIFRNLEPFDGKVARPWSRVYAAIPDLTIPAIAEADHFEHSRRRFKSAFEKGRENMTRTRKKQITKEHPEGDKPIPPPEGPSDLTLEAEIFQRLRPVPEKLLKYGFQKGDPDSVYRYGAAIKDGAFNCEITVTEQGEVSGRVTDAASSEEYLPLRMPGSGAYAASVREAYRELLLDIARQCFQEVLFPGDQANRITAEILKRYDVRPDFPWQENPSQNRYRSYGVFRHRDSGKWFALIMNVREDVIFKNGSERPLDIVNLKAAPEDMPDLLRRPGIFPGYHMNHRHWISVILSGELSDLAVMSLIEESRRLTSGPKKRPRSSFKDAGL
ncbi:MAG: MmcQ/YjbR family DNA-binding protein [Succinimonas sp.]|nr:MmcQ/YjbR family DNA-binding protein [Succinimonas sp.]